MTISAKISSATLAVTMLLAAGCSDPETEKRSFFDSGTKYLSEGRVREAITQFRSAIAVDPRFGEARQSLAEAYLKDNEFARALPEAIRAADLLPDSREAQLQAVTLMV